MGAKIAVLLPVVEAAAVETTSDQFSKKGSSHRESLFFVPGERNFRRGRKGPLEFRSPSPKSGQGVGTAQTETILNHMKLTLLLVGIAFVSLTLGACKHRGYPEKTPVAQPVCCPPAQVSYGYTK